MHTLKKMYGSSYDRCRFNFRFDTNCNMTQELQEFQRHNKIVPVGSSGVIKYHQLLSKVISITDTRKLRFDHLAKTSFQMY